MRTLLGVLFALLASAAFAASPSPTASPSPAASAPPSGKGPVILFLVDNSASLPPLDPLEKRTVALEKVFSFLQGQPYRLVLFGGRDELFFDDASKYANNGQWTDFFAAFDAARRVQAEYPQGTDFRVILLTDGLLDPNPKDWEVPLGKDLKTYVRERTLEEVRALDAPLYVILVGDMPAAGTEFSEDADRAPRIVMELVHAANGRAASPRAQRLASFLGDDGVLLKKFIYRVQPHEGLTRLKPVVQRIVMPPTPKVEIQLLTIAIVPLTLFVFLLTGIVVRSFPGPGDAEVLDLAEGAPLHVVTDRMHKLEDGGWGNTGLSLVAELRDAEATFTYQRPSLDLNGTGLDTDTLDPLGQRAMNLSVDALRRVLSEMKESGSKEEKIWALQLEYVAQRTAQSEAETILTTPVAERKGITAPDFLRAKAHLVGNPELRRILVDSRVQLATYGPGGSRQDLFPGTRFHLGKYGFVVKDVTRGGRKDVRLVLLYDRIPSLVGMKNWLPRGLQQVARFRRSSQRQVS